MKLEDVPLVVAVASGKGGVGKTTVSSDLARALRDADYTVGLVDADVSTPNSPEVLGGEDLDLSDQRLSTHDALVPPVVDGIQLVSQGVVLPDDVPVLRDGEWRSQAVADYVENVDWKDGTDVVVVDTPPGTGEEIQVIAAAAPPDYGVVVSTPHPSSIRDAKKTHEFLKQAEIDHDMVVNMAYIPSEDVLDHATSGADFTEIDGVGDSIGESIHEMLSEVCSDFKLFGYNDHDIEVGAEVVGTVPYTTEYEARSGEYDEVVSRIADMIDSGTPDAAAPAAGEGGS